MVECERMTTDWSELTTAWSENEIWLYGVVCFAVGVILTWVLMK